MIDPAPGTPGPVCVLLVRGAYGLHRAEQWLLAAGADRVVLAPLDDAVSKSTALCEAYCPPAQRRPELPHLLVGEWTMTDWQAVVESLEPGTRFVFDTHSAALTSVSPSPQLLRQTLTDRGVVGIPLSLHSTPLDCRAAQQQLGDITSCEYRLADWKAPALSADLNNRDHLGVAVWSLLQDFAGSGALPGPAETEFEVVETRLMHTLAHCWSGTTTRQASRFWGHAAWQSLGDERPITLTIDLDFGSPVVDQRGWCITGTQGQLRQGRLYRCSPAGEVIDEPLQAVSSQNGWPSQHARPVTPQPTGERLSQALEATPDDIDLAWSQLQRSWQIWQAWQTSWVRTMSSAS